MKFFLFVALALSLAPGAAAKDRPKLSIYVFTETDPSGFTTKAQKIRTDTVKDVKSDVRLRWSRTFVTVETKDAADIVLEVKDPTTGERNNELAGLANALNPNMPQRNERDLVTFGTVTLTFGDYTTDLKPRGGAGFTVTAELADWVKLNQEKVYAGK